MGRNNKQNNAKTQHTRNRRQNIQNKKTNIKQINKKTQDNQNTIKGKKHKANSNDTMRI
jgi:hypothetical protein